MGIEAKIKQMDPKKRKLFENIISISMLFIIAYGAISFAIVIMETGDVIAFFGRPAFINTIVPLIFIGFAWKILKGGKIQMPSQQQNQPKKQLNIPDTYGVKKYKQQRQQQPQQTQQPTRQPATQPRTIRQTKPRQGTWRCPKCNFLAIGNVCKKCGYRRQ